MKDNNNIMCGLGCEIVMYEKVYSINKNIILDNISKHSSSIKKYAFILHNKDNEKDNHYHIFLQFKQTRYFDEIASWFNVNINDIEKLKSRYNNAVLYLVHKHQPEKYQYDAKDVISNFDFTSLVNDDDIKSLRIDFDLFPITHYKDIYKYDAKKLRDINTLYNNYLELKKKESNNRDMRVLYISGPSAVGKTTLAKIFASQTYSNDEIFISSSSNDILDGYLGEKCIILDDLRDDALKYADLLKFLDNNTNSSVKSRYSNKQLVRCELVIITSIKEPYQLYTNVGEDKKQLYRRIKEYLLITKNVNDYILVSYLYDDVSNQYKLNQQVNVTKLINDYFAKYQQQIFKSITDTLIENGLAVKVK